MSFHPNHPEPTVLKALHWLNKQPDNWVEHIKDTNIAVKMYLKSQNKCNKQKSTTFSKEITQLLTKDEGFKSEEPLGAFLTDRLPAECKEEQKPSPPADQLVSSSLSEDNADHLFPEKKKSQSFFLDEKSLHSLEKTKKELNMESEQETLRLLIQLGQKSIEKLY